MLIGTSDLRSWLNLDDSDKRINPKLETAIQAVQSFIEDYTCRQLEATYYQNHQDYSILDGNGSSSIYVSQYPISYVDAVYVDSDRQWGSASLIGSADLIIYWKEGRIDSEAGYFMKGRRNVRIDYIAGYGASSVSSYPIPYDLKQVMLEMATQTIKEGITGVHSVVGGEETKFVQMLSSRTMWRQTLNKYKNFSARL